MKQGQGYIKQSKAKQNKTKKVVQTLKRSEKEFLYLK